MSNDRPQHFPIKLVTFIFHIVRFDLKRLRDPHGNVAHDQERKDLTSWFLPAQLLRIAASAQTVYDHGGLSQHLSQLKKMLK